MGLRLLLICGSLFLACGCTTPTHMKRIQLVSFVQNATKGRSLGRRTGVDCSWKVLGVNIGSASISEAIDKARRNATDLDAGGQAADFMRNVSSVVTRSNYLVATNQCYEVSGQAFAAGSSRGRRKGARKR